jgi:hypothetical protein
LGISVGDSVHSGKVNFVFFIGAANNAWLVSYPKSLFINFFGHSAYRT